MELFSGSNPDDLDFAIRSNRFGHVADFHARNFGNEGLASVHALKASDDKAYALFQRHPEASHPKIGNRQHASLAGLSEVRTEAAAVTQSIEFANPEKSSWVPARVRSDRVEFLV